MGDSFESLDSGCGSAHAEAHVASLSLVVMLDRSGSMGDGVNGVRALKWDPITQALSSFFGASDAMGLKASLQLFPRDQDTCNPSGYYTQLVGMRSLPDALPFTMAMGAATPGGNTPTRPAILGAIDYARDIHDADPKNKAAIVLVTDGEPDFCNSSVENVSGEVGKVANLTPTFVIGVGPSQSGLNQIAAAGGTQAAVFVSVGNAQQTQSEFTAALQKVRSDSIPCRVAIPSQPDTDYEKVNVVYSDGTNTDTLVYERDCATGNGWRYDNEDMPTQIELCSARCEAARRVLSANLDVVFGCRTHGNLIR